MKKHRFFVEKKFIKEDFITLPEDLSNQAIKVLRLKKGEQFIVLDNTGKEYVVELAIPDSKSVSAKIIEQHANINEPRTRITLYQSLLPREKFELALQKSVEVGISKFVPLKATYTIHGKEYVNEQKLERWRSVIREAAEQSERGLLSEISTAQDFKTAIQNALKIGPVFVTHPYHAQPFSDKSASADSADIAVFIGPEGGFTEEEINFAKSQGATIISLGKRILRSETAGPVLCFHLLSILEGI